MTKTTLPLCVLALSIGLLAGCGEPASDPANDDAGSVPASEQPTSPPPAPRPPESAPPQAEPAAFAPAPAQGWVARATCHMGACTWNRYEQIERSGGDEAPGYTLRLTQGESQHPGDYPASPESVQIAWDAAQIPATVRCSHTSPHASAGDNGGALALNPQGVSGAMQALANLYFATCHGEYGNDAVLAGKYGYDLR